MRLLPACAALLSTTLPVIAQPASRQVWQPVQEYFIHRQPGREPMRVEGKQRLNSFVAYTHLGTDFGFHGPAEHTIQWQSDEICAHLGQEPESWAGLWHSLSGLARDPGKTLDFAAAWPACINASHQPRISGVMLAASGRGGMKLEIKAADQTTLWSHSLDVQSLTQEPTVFPVAAQALPNAKLITWTAEPGAEVCVTGLRLAVETPPIAFDEYVLAASYAKLARSFDNHAGMVKDRAHVEDGAFESIPATGMFVLATAVVAREPLGIVSSDYARAILRQVHQSVRALKRPLGLLPHFVRRSGDAYDIHRGTEYSTVDTALFYHSLLLAAQVLNDEGLKHELLAQIGEVQFDQLRLADGCLSHGLKDDGVTMLPHGWGDWGGETALVMLLEAMAEGRAPPKPMKRPGQAWQGTGFISEIQSLFYPDFDTDNPDALDGVKWRSVRRNMLAAQRANTQSAWPQSLASKIGLYGLSAGEGEHGDRYHVGGTDLPNQHLLHPHYVLMSATLAENPAEVYELLGKLEKAGFFPPWGMVENVTVNGDNYLPMNGSLNAAFETLGAYHLLAKHRGLANAVYTASLSSPELRRAVQIFYPVKVGEMPMPVQTAELKGR